jgi:plastocyanin
MKTLLAMLCACLALGLVAAGCGDDDEDGGDSANAPAATQEEQAPTTTEETDSGGAAADAVEVSMEDITFKPGTVEVPVGGTVTWVNDDSVGHDVTKSGGPGPDFASGEPGAMASGDTFDQKFETAGKIDYVCTVHPGMKGTVTVK